MKLVMKRLAAALVLALAASCAHVPPAAAGPLTFRFSLPTQENAGTCPAPVLMPMLADATLRGVYSWAGPVTGLDSTYAVPGATVVVLKYVPSGTYTVRVHAANLNRKLGVHTQTQAAIALGWLALPSLTRGIVAGSYHSYGL